MAPAQSLLLQQPSSLQWKNHSIYHSPQFPACASFSHINIHKIFKKLSLKCFWPNNNCSSSSNNDVYKHKYKIGFERIESKQNPVEIPAESVMNAVEALQRSAAVAGLLLMYDTKSVSSGGWMGGSSFSPSSSSSCWCSCSCWCSSSSCCSRKSSLGSLIVDTAFALWYASKERTSVVKLQFALSGSLGSLQKNLNQIAETADTSTSNGLHYVLTETVLALLRHLDYSISAYSSVDVKWDKEEGEKIFLQLSFEERGKFDEATLVNVNNMKKQSSTITRAEGLSNNYIVITILVAAKGKRKLPPINNLKNLEEALQMLASVSSSETLAVEVLWTPQKEDDTLSRRKVLKDYPLLRPF